jgi:hypothetical protein
LPYCPKRRTTRWLPTPPYFTLALIFPAKSNHSAELVSLVVSLSLIYGCNIHLFFNVCKYQVQEGSQYGTAQKVEVLGPSKPSTACQYLLPPKRRITGRYDVKIETF